MGSNLTATTDRPEPEGSDAKSHSAINNYLTARRKPATFDATTSWAPMSGLWTETHSSYEG